MRHSLRFLLVFFALMLTGPAIADNATRFVVEDHPVPLRSGFSDQDHTLATLRPGESVKVFKENKKEGQARVQRESGEVGWVEAKDLRDALPEPASTPVAIPIIEENQPKTPEQLQQELGRLQSELVQVRAASADVLRIQAERDQLQSTVISLKRELETLSQEKNTLDEDQQQTWFLIGGIVLFGGILVGILLPRISVRRRNQWGSF
jgi:SH3 domain protein